MEAILLVAIAAIAAIVIIVKNKSANSSGRGAEPNVKLAAPVAAQAMPAIGDGIDEETVAAIMAAISCMTDSVSGTRYAVRSINRVQGGRPAWCVAGMQQNTRSF